MTGIADLVLAPSHLGATRALGYGLRVGLSLDNALTVARVWRLRLTAGERRRLLVASAMASERKEALELMGNMIDVLAGRTGPLPVFGALEDDADHWARSTPLPVLRAYGPALFAALPARDRCQFAAAAEKAVRP